MSSSVPFTHRLFLPLLLLGVGSISRIDAVVCTGTENTSNPAESCGSIINSCTASGLCVVNELGDCCTMWTNVPVDGKTSDGCIQKVLDNFNYMETCELSDDTFGITSIGDGGTTFCDGVEDADTFANSCNGKVDKCFASGRCVVPTKGVDCCSEGTGCDAKDPTLYTSDCGDVGIANEPPVTTFCDGVVDDDTFANSCNGKVDKCFASGRCIVPTKGVDCCSEGTGCEAKDPTLYTSDCGEVGIASLCDGVEDPNNFANSCNGRVDTCTSSGLCTVNENGTCCAKFTGADANGECARKVPPAGFVYKTTCERGTPAVTAEPPTTTPTKAPTTKPTAAPTAKPTTAPTAKPTTAAPTASGCGRTEAGLRVGSLLFAVLSVLATLVL